MTSAPFDYDIVDGDTETEEPTSSRASTALVPVRAQAIVPYKKKEHLPALLTGALGDLDAYIRAANQAPMLSEAEEHDLAERLRDKGDLEAAQRLIFSHLRLVVSVARGYLGYGLPHADLIQEGNIGLMKAIKHYDPNKGARLMTYATPWIRSEIQEYIIRNWRLVKLATTKNQRKLFFNLRQMHQSDKALTPQEAESIALSLDVKPKDVFDMETRMSGGDTPLEAPDSSDGETAFAPIDWLTDESDSPVQILESRAKETLSREGLRRALNSLDGRSRRVIEARYLREDDEGNPDPLTLSELAKEMGVSLERVRQIEKKAIKAMHATLTEGEASHAQS